MINNFRPYKQDIDKILNQIKDNKDRLPSIIEEQAKQGEKSSQSESNKKDSDNDNTDDSSDEPEDTNDTDEDTDADY